MLLFFTQRIWGSLVLNYCVAHKKFPWFQVNGSVAERPRAANESTVVTWPKEEGGIKGK
jgi:hypothetical protein